MEFPSNRLSMRKYTFEDKYHVVPDRIPLRGKEIGFIVLQQGDPIAPNKAGQAQGYDGLIHTLVMSLPSGRSNYVFLFPA
jgi:hypothetical protein